MKQLISFTIIWFVAQFSFTCKHRKNCEWVEQCLDGKKGFWTIQGWDMIFFTQKLRIMLNWTPSQNDMRKNVRVLSIAKIWKISCSKICGKMCNILQRDNNAIFAKKHAQTKQKKWSPSKYFKCFHYFVWKFLRLPKMSQKNPLRKQTKTMDPIWIALVIFVRGKYVDIQIYFKVGKCTSSFSTIWSRYSQRVYKSFLRCLRKLPAWPLQSRSGWICATFHPN